MANKILKQNLNILKTENLFLANFSHLVLINICTVTYLDNTLYICSHLWNQTPHYYRQHCKVCTVESAEGSSSLPTSSFFCRAHSLWLYILFLDQNISELFLPMLQQQWQTQKVEESFEARHYIIQSLSHMRTSAAFSSQY